MSEIKIVTAFFDIGRDKFDIWPKNNEQYFEHFKFWARIQNELTVYCDPQNAEKILSIRRYYGLENKTNVIPLENIYQIESEMYERMCQIEANEHFKQFRYYNNALSNRAQYDYIMLMKWWCLQDVASKEEKDCLVAWIDFGYNHGDSLYTLSEEFDFLWEYDFPKKINAFCLNNPDDVTAVDMLQFQTDCFIGGSLIMPRYLCNQFWKYIKEAMWSLISLDCIDDDQQLIMMVYKRHKELFNIQICDWFEMFLCCSNQTFTTRQKHNQENSKSVTSVSFLRRCYHKLKKMIRREKREQKLDPFLERILEKKRKFYG